MQTVTTLHVRVPEGSVDEQVKFCKEFQTKLANAGLVGQLTTALDAMAADDPNAHMSLEEQLARLAGYWKTRSGYVRELHDGLLGLGYDAFVPEVRSKSASRPSSYIRYVDPADDTTLGTINSGSFTFAGKRFQQSLRDEPGTQLTRDGIRIQLDSPAAVRLVLRIAEAAKIKA